MKEKFIEECATIQQNCTYTAEAHHRMALRAKNKALWFEVVPAVIAALSGTLVAAGVASVSLLPLTVLSASASAIAAVLNPNKAYQEHLSAAKSFTALKHDARFLRDALSAKMGEETFAIAVENLHGRYSELLKATPPTDDKNFEEARKVVQSGIHDPDRAEDGSLR